MEIVLNAHAAQGARLTQVDLDARLGVGAFSVELTLEPHVYLHDVNLALACGARTTTVPQAYKDESSAVWRQVDTAQVAAGAIQFGVAWLAIANASPGAFYTAILTLRDTRGALLGSGTRSKNPARVRRQIGPANDPTDVGHFGVRIARRSLE
jgi:hypothetical protein